MNYSRLLNYSGLLNYGQAVLTFGLIPFRVLQLSQGILSVGQSADVGGVAVWAHVGGFAVGTLLARLTVPARRGDNWRYR